MYFLFKTEQKNPKPKKSTAAAGEKHLPESCKEVLCVRMTKWTMIHKSKKKHKGRMKQKSKNKTYHSPINFFQSKTPPHFWLIMQTSYSAITYQINGKLRASKSLRTAGKGETSSWDSKEKLFGEKDAPKACFFKSDNAPASMRQLDQQHHTSYHHQCSPSHHSGGHTTLVWMSPWILTRCRPQLKFPSFLMPSSILLFLLCWASYHKYLHSRGLSVTSPGSSRGEKSLAVLALHFECRSLSDFDAAGAPFIQLPQCKATPIQRQQLFPPSKKAPYKFKKQHSATRSRLRINTRALPGP